MAAQGKRPTSRKIKIVSRPIIATSRERASPVEKAAYPKRPRNRLSAEAGATTRRRRHHCANRGRQADHPTACPETLIHGRVRPSRHLCRFSVLPAAAQAFSPTSCAKRVRCRFPLTGRDLKPRPIIRPPTAVPSPRTCSAGDNRASRALDTRSARAQSQRSQAGTFSDSINFSTRKN